MKNSSDPKNRRAQSTMPLAFNGFRKLRMPAGMGSVSSLRDDKSRPLWVRKVAARFRTVSESDPAASAATTQAKYCSIRAR